MSRRDVIAPAAALAAARGTVVDAAAMLRRIAALPLADQRRTVEFMRNHHDPGLRACAIPLEDALATMRLIGGAP